jgi:hypothetical protein
MSKSKATLGIWLIAAISLAFGTEDRQAHAEILNTDSVLSIRPSPGTAGKPLKVVMIVNRLRKNPLPEPVSI